MVQGILGGGTSYDRQSLDHISKDISSWINITIETISLFSTNINDLKKIGFWNKIDFDFMCLLNDTPIYLETYLNDLNQIQESIKKDNIKKREVHLLRKLGQDAFKLNAEYGMTYHNETRYWKDYGNPDFQIAENLYASGRDFFVTLQDAANSSYRLEDYINDSPSIINQQNINQNISNSSSINAAIGNNINLSIDSIYDKFEQERNGVIDKINGLENLNQDLKRHIDELLLDSSIAIKDNDQVRQGMCISNLKGFLVGLGEKGKAILDILSSSITVATFFKLL